MVGRERKNAIQDIRKILLDLGVLKIQQSSYFTYNTSNNLDSYLLKNFRRYESHGLYTNQRISRYQ